MTQDPPQNVPLAVDTLARNVWGEARGCGAAGMRHVASITLNRASHPSWWGNNIVAVCIQPWQFSCRNANDPNLAKLLAVTVKDPEFAIAMQVAQEAVAGQLPDETNGADSYYALSMHAPPAWAKTAVRTFADGWHAFYRTVAAAPPGSRPDVRNVSVHVAVPQVEAGIPATEQKQPLTADQLMAAELQTLNPAVPS